MLYFKYIITTRLICCSFTCSPKITNKHMRPPRVINCITYIIEFMGSMKMCVWNKSWTGIDEMWMDCNDDWLPKNHLPLCSSAHIHEHTSLQTPMRRLDLCKLIRSESYWFSMANFSVARQCVLCLLGRLWGHLNKRAVDYLKFKLSVSWDRGNINIDRVKRVEHAANWCVCQWSVRIVQTSTGPATAAWYSAMNEKRCNRRTFDPNP